MATGGRGVMVGLTHNFRDAQGRCFIAGTPVHPDAYAELEAAWAEVDRLADGIQRYIDSEHTASGANYAWTHRLNSGDWECTRCGNAWPCPTERLRVLLDVAGDDREDGQ